jgi:hypothetical protein
MHSLERTGRCVICERQMVDYKYSRRELSLIPSLYNSTECGYSCLAEKLLPCLIDELKLGQGTSTLNDWT